MSQQKDLFVGPDLLVEVTYTAPSTPEERAALAREEIRKETGEETCWHCGGLNSCDCMFCGKNLPWNKGWVAGSCSACAARKAVEPLVNELIAKDIDPREIRYWVMAGNRHDAAGPHKLFDPFFVYRRDSAARTAEQSSSERALTTDQPREAAADFTAMPERDEPPRKPQNRGRRK